MQMIGTIHSQSHLHYIKHVHVRFLIAGTLPATASNYVSNADPRNAEQTHVTIPKKSLMTPPSHPPTKPRIDALACFVVPANEDAGNTLD